VISNDRVAVIDLASHGCGLCEEETVIAFAAGKPVEVVVSDCAFDPAQAENGRADLMVCPCPGLGLAWEGDRDRTKTVAAHRESKTR